MQSFLESVLDDFPDWKTAPESCTFVLPGKRAGFFLKTLMARKAGRTLLAPEILSIESFVEQVSGLRYATSTKLLFSLYEAFLEQKGVEPESFHDFSKWGQMLLQDFNEIDRYLVDPEAFFSYLGSLQEIRHWTLDGSSTPMIDKRIRFWKSLGPIYHRFRDKLASEGLGYQGQVYRAAAGRIGSYVEEDPSRIHIFMGFNALSKAEEAILQEILGEGNAHIYWDADPYYLDNPVHDAGLFIRKHQMSWSCLQKEPLKGISDLFTSSKHIQITGLPKSVSQAKYCGTLVEEILKRGDGTIGHTALVLGDETLMNPILHSLPESLDAVNVTMGYPLKDSPVAQLFHLLFEAFAGATKYGLPVKQVLLVLSHPFLQGWLASQGFSSRDIAAQLVRENTFYLQAADFEEYALPPGIRELLSLVPAPGPADLIHRFIKLLERLRPAYQEGRDAVSLEYLHHFHVLFSQLLELTGQYPFVNDLKSLRILYEQLVREGRIDLEGEPLEGLQIMGMLESRCLDFESVIITSVNEGILPAGKTNASLIPYDVKKHFGLPTFKEKDAVYTYHFYRLLQRAKNIYICYNTEPDALEGGEPSRFIHQLRNDPRLAPHIRDSLAAPRVSASPAASTVIPKSPALLDLLRQKAMEGFSPTSLSRYVENPLLFYSKGLLGIRDTEELEETVAANTFGNIIHETLETLYRPLVGRRLEQPDIAQMATEAPAELHKAFQKHFLKGSEPRGKNLIALQVMNKYLELFLQMERERVRRHDVRILGVEEKLIREFPSVPGLEFPIRLKGTVDRIEEVDGVLQVIDYKTGKVEPRHLRIQGWETLLLDPQKARAFQVLCYCWLLQERFPVSATGLKAGVYSFKNTGMGLQWFGLHTSGRNHEESITRPILAEFQGTLEALFREIFNPAIPFAERQPA